MEIISIDHKNNSLHNIGTFVVVKYSGNATKKTCTSIEHRTNWTQSKYNIKVIYYFIGLQLKQCQCNMHKTT